METGIPISIWESPFPYGAEWNGSPFPYGELEIPVSIWESPFPYREHNEMAPHFHMAITIRKRGFTHPLEIPISIWESPFPHRELNETVLVSIWWSPYGNGDLHIPWKSPFPYGDPRFHIGSWMKQFPVSIWWSPYGNGEPFHCAPYTETVGSPMTRLPVSIWWLPYGNGDRHIPVWKWSLSFDPRFHMGKQME